MDLLEFIRNTGFQADGRQAIMHMRRNYGLKKKLASDVQHVQLTIEECDELLYTLLQMFDKHAAFDRPITPVYAPIPRPRTATNSRRTSFMSVDPHSASSLQVMDAEDDYTSNVIETEFVPPPPPPPPPPAAAAAPLPTPPAPPKQVPPPPPPQPDYLDDIKKGVTLKPVSRDMPPPPPPPKSSADMLAVALRNKLNERREVTEASDLSEPNSDWST
ncbi:capsid protein [Betabaculovirus altermyunipunctae]|uniref:Capsid protein n=1 Tax=Betabaculovirus altermyunipunctae TaxID=3051996 RepID=A0A1S5YDT7_9BBAC|nr:capsid protein [Betabaculovirus altermyunipunctae]AQQ80272.1 capsid protein [Betabaculovirus altermyunipunctae]